MSPLMTPEGRFRSSGNRIIFVRLRLYWGWGDVFVSPVVTDCGPVTSLLILKSEGGGWRGILTFLYFTCAFARLPLYFLTYRL